MSELKLHRIDFLKDRKDFFQEAMQVFFLTSEIPGNVTKTSQGFIGYIMQVMLPQIFPSEVLECKEFSDDNGGGISPYYGIQMSILVNALIHEHIRKFILCREEFGIRKGAGEEYVRKSVGIFRGVFENVSEVDKAITKIEDMKSSERKAKIENIFRNLFPDADRFEGRGLNIPKILGDFIFFVFLLEQLEKNGKVVKSGTVEKEYKIRQWIRKFILHQGNSSENRVKSVVTYYLLESLYGLELKLVNYDLFYKVSIGDINRGAKTKTIAALRLAELMPNVFGRGIIVRNVAKNTSDYYRMLNSGMVKNGMSLGLNHERWPREFLEKSKFWEDIERVLLDVALVAMPMLENYFRYIVGEGSISQEDVFLNESYSRLAKELKKIAEPPKSNKGAYKNDMKGNINRFKEDDGNLIRKIVKNSKIKLNL